MVTRSSNRPNNTNTSKHSGKADTPQAGSGGNAAGSDMDPESDAAHKVVALRKPKGTRTNFLEQEFASIQEGTANKIQATSEARQRFAEANDLWSQGREHDEEARNVAAKAALIVSTSRLNGEMSAEEVSGLLGDIFGYKPKKDGTPSKTPDGQGEALRKRIVRLAAARDYVNDVSADGFFAGCPKDEVCDVLNGVMNGTVPFWQGYEDFAAIKRALQVPVLLAFNPKRIAEIVTQLQQPGAAQKFVNNPSLRQAYSELWALLRVVGEEAAEIANAA